MSEQDHLSPQELDRILLDSILPDYSPSERTSLERPKAILLAGQPGAGKGGLSRRIEAELQDDVVTIDPEALRDYRPDIRRLRETHPYTWAPQTQSDADIWAEKLLAYTAALKKNLIYNATLNNGEWLSALIDELRSKGYEVEVRVVAAPTLESTLGIDQRFTCNFDVNAYGRHTLAEVHDEAYETLPGCLDLLHQRTDTRIRIFYRDGVELYDSAMHPHTPCAALQHALEARLKDPAITHQLRDGWRAQGIWHRDLTQRLASTSTGVARQERGSAESKQASSTWWKRLFGRRG